MDSALKIRPYNAEDKPALVEVLKLNVPAYFDETEVDSFEAYLDSAVEKYFVAEWHGDIIGSGGINFENNGKRGKISWDLINPAFHGRGIGSRLLAYRIELLKSTDRVEVISVRTSQFAYRFYEKNGFVVREVQKDYWASGFDLYDMVYEGT